MFYTSSQQTTGHATHTNYFCQQSFIGPEASPSVYILSVYGCYTVQMQSWAVVTETGNINYLAFYRKFADTYPM